MEDVNTSLGITDASNESNDIKSSGVIIHTQNKLNRNVYCSKMLDGFALYREVKEMDYSVFNLDKYIADNHNISDKDFVEYFERDFGALANRSSMIKQEKYLKTIRTIVVVFFVLAILSAIIMVIATLFASSHSTYPSY